MDNITGELILLSIFILYCIPICFLMVKFFEWGQEDKYKEN